MTLALGPTPEGRQRSRFLAVGCADNTVRVISLDPDSCMQSLSMQALTATPESLAITNSVDPATGVSVSFIYRLLSISKLLPNVCIFWITLDNNLQRMDQVASLVGQ